MTIAHSIISPALSSNPDATLFEMIKRYAEGWDRLGKLAEDDPRWGELSHASELLAVEIITTPTDSPKAIAAQRRIWEQEMLEDVFLIDLIVEVNSKRIAAAR
jgi:hypothetical protein